MCLGGSNFFCGNTFWPQLRKSCLLLVLLAYLPLHAQDDSGEVAIGATDTSVYVTTQDRSSLRAGPGTNFERVAIVPAAVTLPAVGRSADGQWIQVEYVDVRGWIAYWLLVWSGDISTLEVDGIDPEPFVRRIGAAGVTTRETPIYATEVTLSDQVGVLPPGTLVELTARLGGGRFFHYQILHEGELYWVGSWNIRVVEGRTRQLLDTSYLHVYTRVTDRLSRDISDSINTMNRIEGIWQQLDAGESVSCDNIPEYIDGSRVADADIRRETIFVPLVTTLDSAIAHTNTAISLIRDACGRADEGVYLTSQDVRDALEEVNSARREFNLVNSLLSSLRARDPLR